MKRLRQIINEIKTLSPEPSADFTELLWSYICYSPKMPLRLAQEQLLQGAEKATLTLNDNYFAQQQLSFNTFKWGSGKYKLLLTHGWASKAADFNDLINALLSIADIEIIAFDAPGNGSSEGELSNLLLYADAVKAIVSHYGELDVFIGHSLGAMANIFALRDLQITPSLLVSITPLVRLKENFEASMNALNIPEIHQAAFLANFETKFGVPASQFTLDNYHDFNTELNHWVAYDSNDAISPYAYLKPFLDSHPFIKAINYDGTGHDKAIKCPAIISDLVAEITSALDLVD